MKNLAGCKECDDVIEMELKKAKIPIVTVSKSNSEVPYTLIGILVTNHHEVIGFTFKRAWTYWIVKGKVPLKIAEELYDNPIGKVDIRVAGHCGCPPPKEWAFPEENVFLDYLKENKIVDGITNGELAKLCNNGIIKGDRFVTTYHIDSQEGLNLFAETIKKLSVIKFETD